MAYDILRVITALESFQHHLSHGLEPATSCVTGRRSGFCAGCRPDLSAPKIMSPQSRSLRLKGPHNYHKMRMMPGSSALKHLGVVPNGHGMNLFAVIQ